MADQLQIDLVFVANPNDALAALVDINDAAEVVTKTVEDAVGAAGDLSKELANVEAPGLEAASEAVIAMAGADLSGLADATGTLAEAAVPAEEIAASLSEAAIAAGGLGVEIDPGGAAEIAANLDEALLAATGLSVNLSDAFEEAKVEAGGLRGALADVLNFAASTAEAVAEVAERFDDAAGSAEDAADTVAALSSAAEENAQAQDDAAEGAEETAQNVGETNVALETSGRLAAYLKDQFVGIVETSHNVLPNIGNITRGLIGAVTSLTGGGVAGTLGLGIAAGAAAALVAGEQYKNAMNTIVTTTGATGAELDGLKESFDDLLGSSGKNAGELATIMSQLTRDTGLTGDSLETLTRNTNSFLRVTGGGVGDVRTMNQAIKALGIELTDAAQFQDQVTAAQKAFGGNLSTILSQIRTAGPALKTLGFDTGQIAGLITQFDQAGLSVQRLIPGFTKLAKEAKQHGQTAGDAFGDLTTRVLAAKDTTAALSEVQGIFSGRMATQFVTAVRNGTISVEEINKVMATSPGIVSRLGGELAGLAGQLGQIRNQFGAALGPVGAEILKGLREGIEDVKPTMQALADILKALSPAFTGFAAVLVIPLEVLERLSGPLGFLADQLDRIPEPLLQVVGLFTALSIIPFGKIASGIADIARALATYVAGRAAMLAGTAAAKATTTADDLDPLFAGGGAAAAKKSAVSGGAAASAIPYVGIAIAAATIAFVGWNAVMEKNKAKQEELTKTSEALAKAIGDVSLASDDARKSFTERAADPAAGILDQKELDRLSKAGLTVNDVFNTVNQNLNDPSSINVGNAARAQMVASYGGFVEMLRKTNPELKGVADRLDENSEAEERARVRFIETGKVEQYRVAGARDLVAVYNKVRDAANEEAATQLVNLEQTGKMTVAQRNLAMEQLGFNELKGHEAAVLDQANKNREIELAQRLGLTGLTDAETQAAGALVEALTEGEQTQAAINTKRDQATKLERNLIAVMSGTDGTISLQDQVNAAVKAGVTDSKELAEATARLQAAYEKVRGPSEQFKAAQTSILQGFDKGIVGTSALDKAVVETGIGADAASDMVNQLTADLAEFNDTGQPTIETTANIKRAWDDGVISGQEYAEIIELSGGNADLAKQRIKDYEAQVSETAKVITDLGPSFAEAIDQINKKPAEGEADTRLQGFDDEKAAIEANAKLLQNNIDDRRRHAQAAKELAQSQGFDTSGLDAVLAGLDTETAALEASVTTRLGNVATARDEFGQIIADAAGAPLGLDASLKAMGTVLDTRLTDAETILQLHADGYEDVVQQILGDPGLSDAQKTAFIRELANSTPEKKMAMERQAEALETKQEEILKKAKSQGDIFAEQNVQYEDNARKRGAELATALAGGLAKGVVDARIADIINIATASGAKPEDVIRQLQELGYLGGKAVAEGRNSGIAAIEPPEVKLGLEALGVTKEMETAIRVGVGNVTLDDAGISKEVFGGVQEQMGIRGTEAGEGFVDNSEAALNENPLPIEVANTLTTNVNAGMPAAGWAGGGKYKGGVKDNLETEPLPASTADGLVAPVNGSEGDYSGGLWVGGWAGGRLYGRGLSAGVASYTTSGAAFSDGFTLGESLVAGGNAGLGNQSPSVKGFKSGQLYVEGIALGLESAEQRAVSAATKVGDAVAAALVPGPVDIPVGIDPAAIAAAMKSAPPVLVGAGSLVGAQTGGSFTSTSTVQGSQGEQAPRVHIENVTVTGTTNATADEVAEAMSRKIGWLGITGRHES